MLTNTSASVNKESEHYENYLLVWEDYSIVKNQAQAQEESG